MATGRGGTDAGSAGKEKIMNAKRTTTPAAREAWRGLTEFQKDALAKIVERRLIPTDEGEAAFDSASCADCDHPDIHCYASGCNHEGCECPRFVSREVVP